jgi:hypothetical protein
MELAKNILFGCNIGSDSIKEFTHCLKLYKYLKGQDKDIIINNHIGISPCICASLYSSIKVINAQPI